MSQEMEIQLSSPEYTPEDLLAILNSGFSEFEHEVQFELRGLQVSRSPISDPAVLVAIVSGTSAAIASIINSVFRILERRQAKDGRILVQGSAGTRIEVPAGTPKEEIVKLCEIAKDLDRVKVEIVGVK